MKSSHFLIAAIITICSLSLPTNTHAKPFCQDVRFIFARGSGSPLGDRDYQQFRKALKTELKKHHSTLNYRFYELGTTAHQGFKYPATDVGKIDNALGAVISSGQSFHYGDSVKQGSSELFNYIDTITRQCPHTKFVLGGYSQGAQVISRTLRLINPKQIIYAATFGDPKLYLPEGKGLIPNACRNKNLSDYRVSVPDCRTDEGILSGLIPYTFHSYRGKFGTWCNAADFMCGSYFDFKNGVLSAHLAYKDQQAYQQSARIIVNKLKAIFQSNFTTSIKRDTAFLIDTTGSMRDIYQTYLKHAEKLAEETLKQDGRIALFEYRDFTPDSDYQFKKLCDFSCSPEQFKQNLASLEFQGGGDDNEAALSALQKTMLSLNWRKGATKSIILLSDAGYHQPDLDGTTFDQVVQTSLSIDPVNIYPITTEKDQYQALAQATNGQSFNPFEDQVELSSQILLERPAAELDQESYITPTDQPVTFDASNSYSQNSIIKYEWDLDGDGSFETHSDRPIFTTTYPTNHPLIKKTIAVNGQDFNGFIQVRITDQAGFTSTMSAPIKINPTNTRPTEPLPEISHLTSKLLPGNILQVQFTSSPNTTNHLIVLNDELLGFTKLSKLQFTNFPSSGQLSIIPINQSGRRGRTVRHQLSTSPKLPHAGYRPTNITYY